ncbi:MAG: hypothetical protein JWM44_2076 [Bacilli bacterium]|nr:hypothetical protein [Bacilli bacterium]
MTIKLNLTSASLYQVKHFNYTFASHTLAKIELFCFGLDSFGVQAIIPKTNEEFSEGKLYLTEEVALFSIVNMLEARFSTDNWVRHTEALNRMTDQDEIKKYYNETFYNVGKFPPKRPFED